MALEEHAELVVKTKNGESYTIAESRIVKGSLTASSSCSSGGGIPAGACNIGTASVAFRAPSGLTYKKLYRATVEIYAWYQGYSKELYGTYNVSSAENNYGVYTLSLSDNISLLDESCYAANDTENAENWLYSQMAGRWNVPSVILNYICNAYNVPHYNAAENEKFVPDSGNTALSTGVSSECSVESVKDFANYLAEYLGCFIVAAPDGRVRFSRLGEREYKTELNKSNISRGTLQRSPYYVHPSVWKVSFDSGYGSSWYVSSDLPDDAAPLSINITNNPFWQVQEDRVPADIYGGKVTQMIKYMWDYLYNAAVKKDGNTVEYMINPFSCTVHVPYHFRIGDIVTVRDYVNGDVFRSYLTDITWTFRGGQQISCAGDDTRTLSVGTSRSAAKKSNDYSKYLYRKSKTGSSGGDTNTYTKAEIDAKEGTIQAAADKAQATADGAVSVNNTQNTQISALQKSAHSHSNKDVLDKIEQPYTTAERDKLSGLENYVHPAHTAYNKGMYKVAVDDEGHVTEAETMTKEDIYNAGGVIQSELTFQDYIGDIPLAFMTLFYGGGLRNIAEIGFDRRDDDGKRNFSLKLGGWQDKSTGRLDLIDYIGCQYTITPDPNNSYGTQHYYYVLPAGKSGTIALTSDIPDISEKQDKLTAGTNITISGNTISAKDTTYGNASASAAGLMTAADKKKLDGMDLSKYLPKDGTAKKADCLSTGQLKFGYIYNGTSTATSGKTWARVAYCVVPKGYTTITMAMLITSGNSGVGIFDIDFRTNANCDGFDYFNVKQIITNFPERVSIDSIKAFAKSTNGGMQYEIWYNIGSIYGTRQFTCLSEQRYNGANSNEWKFENHTAADFEASPPTDGTEATYSNCGVVSTAETLTDSGWASTTRNTTFTVTSTVKCRKYGQLVEVRGEVTFSSTYGSPTVCTLPAGYRPAAVVQTCGYTPSGKIFGIKVDMAGVVSFISDAAGTFVKSTTYRIDLTYLLG